MIKFLIKGLLRDKSRSLFPVLTVSAGVFLAVFLYSWMQGIFDDFVKANAQFDSGHVKIMTRAYNKLSDQIPNDLAILGVKDLLKQLQNDEEKMVWVPRIRFGGLLDIPDAYGETRSQGPVMGIAADLLNPESKELEILNLKDSVIEGRLPQKEREILISEEFAKKLGVQIGETATLLSSTMYGSMAMYNFKVAGIVRFGMTALDRSTIIADIRDVRTALDMTDGASEILGYSKDMVYAEDVMMKFAKEFNKKFSKEDEEFSPICLSLSEQRGLGDYINLAKSVGGIIVIVFVVAMSIVLWNSGLLNGLRRYGEIGVRLAMGEPKGTLYRRMVYESIAIGLFGSIVGTVLGLAISYYLQYVGWDIGDMLQKSNVLLKNEIRARVTITSYYIGFLPGLFASVLGTMFAGIGIYRRQTAQLFKELEV